jgi:hypothetical protein
LRKEAHEQEKNKEQLRD